MKGAGEATQHAGKFRNLRIWCSICPEGTSVQGQKKKEMILSTYYISRVNQSTLSWELQAAKFGCVCSVTHCMLADTTRLDYYKLGKLRQMRKKQKRDTRAALHCSPDCLLLNPRDSLWMAALLFSMDRTPKTDFVTAFNSVKYCFKDIYQSQSLNDNEFFPLCHSSTVRYAWTRLQPPPPHSETWHWLNGQRVWMDHGLVVAQWFRGKQST